MANLLDDLAQVREMQGKAPLPSPHMIQGFEPGSPPVPPLRPLEVDSPSGMVEDEFLEGGPPMEEPRPSSPLIPRPDPNRQTGRELMHAAMYSPTATEIMAKLAPNPPAVFALTVLDEVAGWKGREVRLSDDEQKQIRLVVLRAIQRELDADLRPLVRRRPRKSKAAPEPASVERRGPGRPRKVKP